MDKFKCLSFFKCRRKEVGGVCELRTCGGLGKGKLKERQISAFALFGYSVCHISVQLPSSVAEMSP